MLASDGLSERHPLLGGPRKAKLWARHALSRRTALAGGMFALAALAVWHMGSSHTEHTELIQKIEMVPNIDDRDAKYLAALHSYRPDLFTTLGGEDLQIKSPESMGGPFDAIEGGVLDLKDPMCCGKCRFFVDDQGIFSREGSCDAQSCAGTLSESGGSLDFSAKGIRGFAAGVFQGITTLESLDLSHNKFKALKADTFAGLEGLRVLNLQAGELEMMDVKAFSGLKGLHELALAANKITKVQSNSFYGLPELKTLDISGQTGGTLTLESEAFAPLEKSLLTLELIGNSIEKIGSGTFKKLTSLETLGLANNKITDIDTNAFDCPALMNLDLSNNALTTIVPAVYTTLPKIRELDLSHNQITEVPSESFEKCTDLHVLSLNKNKITTVKVNAFKSMESLGELDLSNNEIPALGVGTSAKGVCYNAFKGLISLSVLDLGFNKITNIAKNSFEGCSTLTSLMLKSQNTDPNKPDNSPTTPLSIELKAFVFPNSLSVNILNEKLKGLDSKQLKDQATEDWKIGFQKLETLDLSGNMLYTIKPDVHNTFSKDEIYPSYLEGLEKVTTLDLQGCRFKAPDSNSGKGIMKFDVMKNLEVLHMEKCGLTGSELKEMFDFKNMPNIRTFQLSYNKIDIIQTEIFNNLHSLNSLDLSNNVITSIEKKAFSGLNSVRKDGTDGLRALDLSDNLLTTLPADDGAFVDCFELRILYLQNNKISEIKGQTFEGLHSLEKLDLGNNKIKTLKIDKSSESSYPFFGLEGLKALNMSFNGLETIPDGVFAVKGKSWYQVFKSEPVFAYSLESLDWSNNNIQELKGKYFTGLKSLKVLDMSKNKLTVIKADALKVWDGVWEAKLGTLGGIWLSSLAALDLSEQQKPGIGSLEQHAFRGLTRMIILNLSNNAITSFDGSCFRGPYWFNPVKLLKEILSKAWVGAKYVAQTSGIDKFGIAGKEDPIFFKYVDDSSVGQGLRKVLDAPGKVYGGKPMDDTDWKNFIGNNFDGNLNSVATSYHNEPPFIPLEDLDLSNNKIKKLQKKAFHVATEWSTIQKWQGKEALSHIITLNLANNEIEEVEADAMGGLSHVKTVDLSNNKLTSFNGNWFNGRVFTNEANTGLAGSSNGHFATVQDIEILDLSNNKITEIQTKAFQVNKDGNMEYLWRKMFKLGGFVRAKVYNTISGGSGVGEKMDDSIGSVISDPGFGLSHQYLSSLKALFLNNQSPGLETIQDQAFKGLTRLGILNLQNNKLNKLPPGALRTQPYIAKPVATWKDKSVDVIDFQIGENPIQFLNLANNKFTVQPSAAFKHLVNLKAIFFNANPMKTFIPGAFSQCLGLETVDLRDTPLQCEEHPPLPGGAIPQVDVKADKGKFKCDASIKRITGQLAGSCGNCVFVVTNEGKLTREPDCDPKLCRGDDASLCLSNKEIKSLDPKVFEGLTLIDSLTIAGNRLMGIEPGTFQDLGSVKKLDLSGNQLGELNDEILKGMHDLKFLYLSNNKISDIKKGSFKNQKNLISLHLNNNKLAKIRDYTFEDLPSLVFLDLALNRILTMNPEAWAPLKKLQTLRLQGNYVKWIIKTTFTKLSEALTYLDMSDNTHVTRFETPPFPHLKNLKILKFNNVGAGFDKMPRNFLHGLENLVELDLQQNSLRLIYDDMFQNVPNLKELDLRENKIIDLISDAPFKALKNLEVLKLDWNVDNGAKKGLACCPKIANGVSAKCNDCCPETGTDSTCQPVTGTCPTKSLSYDSDSLGSTSNNNNNNNNKNSDKNDNDNNKNKNSDKNKSGGSTSTGGSNKRPPWNPSTQIG